MRREDESNTVRAGISQEAVYELILMKFLRNCTFHKPYCRKISQWDLIKSEVSNRRNILGKYKTKFFYFIKHTLCTEISSIL